MSNAESIAGIEHSPIASGIRPSLVLEPFWMPPRAVTHRRGAQSSFRRRLSRNRRHHAALRKISVPRCVHPHGNPRRAGRPRDVVKVFPSTALGPGYFKDILAPLPSSSSPNRRVDLKNAGEWIKAGRGVPRGGFVARHQRGPRQGM
jgi:hypothetical protein